MYVCTHHVYTCIRLYVCLKTKEIEPKIKIAEEDTRAYYDKNKNKFETQEKVRASIMLLKFDPKTV